MVSFWKSTRSGLQGGGSGRLEPKSAGFHPKNHLPPPPPKFPHPNPHNPPVFVDEGVEGQAVPPTGGEVLDVHLRVPEAGIGIWGGGQQTTPINMGPGGGWGVLVFGGGVSPCRFHLAPKQQSILGRARLAVVLCLDFDHLDLGGGRGAAGLGGAHPIWGGWGVLGRGERGGTPEPGSGG